MRIVEAGIAPDDDPFLSPEWARMVELADGYRAAMLDEPASPEWDRLVYRLLGVDPAEVDELTAERPRIISGGRTVVGYRLLERPREEGTNDA